MDTLAFLGEDSEFLVYAVAICVALSLIFLGIALISARSGSAYDRRLEGVKQRGSGKRVTTGPIAIKRGESTGAMGELERTIGRWLPRKAALEARLARPLPAPRSTWIWGPPPRNIRYHYRSYSSASPSSSRDGPRRTPPSRARPSCSRRRSRPRHPPWHRGENREPFEEIFRPRRGLRRAPPLDRRRLRPEGRIDPARAKAHRERGRGRFSPQ